MNKLQSVIIISLNPFDSIGTYCQIEVLIYTTNVLGFEIPVLHVIIL